MLTLNLDATQLKNLAELIKQWGRDLGFAHIGITDVQTGEHSHHLKKWLANEFHGEMAYMATHGEKRSHPEQLVPGTQRLICARLDYLASDDATLNLLDKKDHAYIARYALGRDYHKVMRKRLATLAEKIKTFVHDSEYRVFVDSAPVLEKAFAEKAGLGWIGKNTLLLHREAGSWFFLGEILTNLPLPIDGAAPINHCGTCTACLDICPTNAFVGPYELDARKCIAYLTIEYKGSIPEEIRPLMGNRIFGCDDCQLVCPWNKFAQITKEADFFPRHDLDNKTLVELFSWDIEKYLLFTEGSPLRRIGYEGWLRNIAVALGNAPTTEFVINSLKEKEYHESDLVREHVSWALNQHTDKIVST